MNVGDMILSKIKNKKKAELLVKKEELIKPPLKKIKVLTLGDMPLLPSGVGTQTKYVIQALLDSGFFQVVSLGGAEGHPNYDVMRVEEYANDWTIIPVDGYGNKDIVRSVIRTERPDILWFMTDPRFWTWLWEIEDEIRPLMPMVYYHVWDNYPIPYFNEVFYNSNDAIMSISKLTHDIVTRVANKNVIKKYIPHAVDPEIFKPLTKKEISSFKEEQLPIVKDKTIFFWNSRNARRKQSGSLLFWFKKFLDKNNLHDKVTLIMHTDPKDPHGQDLSAIIRFLDLNLQNQVMISPNKYPPEVMAQLYNLADCTISVSDAEGFGLSILESLSCGTPVIATRTGGMQDQIINPVGEHIGIPLEPSSKSIIGSQDIPWIYEDRLNGDDVIAALEKFYFMSEKDKKEMSNKGLEQVEKNFSFSDFKKLWVDSMLEIHNLHGSWPNHKYERWHFEEIKF